MWHIATIARLTSRERAATKRAMSDKQHLYLVDGSAYIFRAYHRLPPLTNPQGTPVGAVYGYTTMLWKLAEDLHKADGPTHLAVILDKGSHTFRNDLYDQYKANRPEPPEDLKPQFPLIRDATRAFSLACIEEEGLEADDLIASYAKEATRRGWDVTIVSSDKDLMQLVGNCAEPHDGHEGGCIDMLDTMKNQRIDIPEVVEKFGVGPELVGDVLALMGDSVDNVPGIYGIGPKTASKLIQDYGSLQGALDAAPSMKPGKLRDRLIEGREMAELSRVLVQLKEDCPLPMPLDDFKLDTVPKEPLAAFLTEHGFTSLLRRLDGGSGSPARTTDLNPPKPQTAGAPAAPSGDRQALPEFPPVDRSAYECVQTLERLEHWIERAFAARAVAIDTETSSIDAMRAELAGVSLALGPNDACYIPLGHGGSDMFAERPDQIDKAAALAALKPLLESDAVLKIGQNIKYDINILARNGIHIAPVDDTMIISFALDAGRSLDGIGGGHGMDELSQRHLGHTTLTFKDICGSGKKQIPFGEVPLARATEYAAEDADVTWRLHALLEAAPGDRARHACLRTRRPAADPGGRRDGTARHQGRPHAARQALRGIRPRDRPHRAGDLRLLRRELHHRQSAAARAYPVRQAGLQGRAQGQERAIFDRPGDPRRARAARRRSGAEGARLAPAGQAQEHLYRRAAGGDQPRHRARPHQLFAWSGRRPAGSPRPTPICRTSRSAPRSAGRSARPSCPRTGNVLLAADYSQIELRLAAHMADVPPLKEAFAAGEDIHSRTAKEMFGTVDRDTRARAKTVNFAILYGISRWGLGGRLGDRSRRGASDHRPLFRALPRHPELHPRHARDGARARLFARRCSAARPGSRGSARRNRPSARAASARRSTRRSRAPAPTSSSGRWRG